MDLGKFPYIKIGSAHLPHIMKGGNVCNAFSTARQPGAFLKNVSGYRAWKSTLDFITQMFGHYQVCLRFLV